MKNKTTKYFIMGLFVGCAAIPILDECITTITSWIQVLSVKANKILVKNNKELLDLQESMSEEIVSYPIGFQAPSNDTSDDDYDYDE